MAATRRNRRSEPASAINKGVDYTRYSTVEQGSTPEQRALNAEIAADQDIELVAHFQDEGISRSLSERPGLQDLFAYLESHGDVRYLVVNELERLTAGVDQRQTITRICKRLHITIVTEDMGMIDPHDEDKMFEADQRAVAAKGEVLKIRRRTRRSLRQKVRAGKTVAMRPAFGIRMKPLVMPDGTELPPGMTMLDGQGRRVSSGQIELHPDEHPWLLKIFMWAAEGVGSEEIARRLTAQGVPTKRGNLTWRGSTINGILDNPLYKGEMTWGLQQTLRDENGRTYLEVRDETDPGRITFESPLGAIIEPETWDAIQELRRQRAEGRKLRHMTRRNYDPQVLDGRVFCGRCGHRMYGRNAATKAYRERGVIHWRFYCYSMRTGYVALPEFGETCQVAHSMGQKQMLDALGGLGGPAGLVTATAGGTTDDSDVRRRRYEGEIQTAKAELARATKFAIKGLIPEEELDEVKADCDARVAAAEERLLGLAEAQEAEVVPFEGEVADSFAALSKLLRDEEIPVAVRQRALDEAGLERLYVDKPRLRLQLRG